MSSAADELYLMQLWETLTDELKFLSFIHATFRRAQRNPSSVVLT